MAAAADVLRTYRPAHEVAARCVVLCCVVAHGEDRTLKFGDWLVREGLWEYASVREQDFLLESSPAERELRNLSWRSEALLILMWCLDHVPEMPEPVQTESYRALLDKVPGPEQPTDEFLGSAKLRPMAEIEEQCRVVQLQHRLLQQTEWNHLSTVAHFEPGVIYERLYALRWLGFDESRWDEFYKSSEGGW